MLARLLLAAVVALLPGVAAAQPGASPPLRGVAEETARCLSERMVGQIIGNVWVEHVDDGYRVVWQPAGLGGANPLFSWLDLARVEADTGDGSYEYTLPRGDHDYLSRHGGHHIAAIDAAVQRCLAGSLGAI